MSFRAAGVNSAQQGPRLMVADRRIDVVVNNTIEQNSGHVLGAEFDVVVDGVRNVVFRSGVVGIADTPERARANAASAWAGQYGAPIAFALALQMGAKEFPPAAKLEIDGQTLFHGPLFLRGNAKMEDVSDDLERTIARVILPILRRAPNVGEFRSANVQVRVDGTKFTNGECRINGRLSPELLQALSTLAWPEGSPGYILKLFFVGPVPAA